MRRLRVFDARAGNIFAECASSSVRHRFTRRYGGGLDLAFLIIAALVGLAV